MSQNLLQIILQILIICLGLYLAFFKSYLQEKGKNVATQEDIGKITKAIEDVKKQFTIEAELLKNNLNIYSGSFQSIKTLERNALVEINLKYSQWLHSLQTFSLVYYSYDFFEPLLHKDLFFSEKQSEFEVAEDNFHLYVHDEELMGIKKELTSATFKLHLSVITHIISFIKNCREYNLILQNMPLGQEVEQNRKYHEKQQPIIESSISEMAELYKKILPHQVAFIKALNYRIYKLIK